MISDAILFWILAFLSLSAGLTVVMIANPIYSALALVMTMVSVAGLFVTLGAYFLAGVQLIVYAGAVMVLFVMVLMLFDLKNEVYAFTQGLLTNVVKLGCLGLLAGLLAGTLVLSSYQSQEIQDKVVAAADQTKALGQLLFTQYLFGFEVLGILLLIVAIGAVALSRSRGGTHHV